MVDKVEKDFLKAEKFSELFPLVGKKLPGIILSFFLCKEIPLVFNFIVIGINFKKYCITDILIILINATQSRGQVKQ